MYFRGQAFHPRAVLPSRRGSGTLAPCVPGGTEGAGVGSRRNTTKTNLFTRADARAGERRQPTPPPHPPAAPPAHFTPERAYSDPRPRPRPTGQGHRWRTRGPGGPANGCGENRTGSQRGVQAPPRPLRALPVRTARTQRRVGGSPVRLEHARLLLRRPRLPPVGSGGVRVTPRPQRAHPCSPLPMRRGCTPPVPTSGTLGKIGAWALGGIRLSECAVGVGERGAVNGDGSARGSAVGPMRAVVRGSVRYPSRPTATPALPRGHLHHR